MNLDYEILQVDSKIKEITRNSGYTKEEAMKLIHIAALTSLSSCVGGGLLDAKYFNVSGRSIMNRKNSP